ncbi:helix-turn-helix domain-containing protein [Mycolicibacterium fortuitum]|nr:helix-turn-helix domain-containing protein [Mycolicibacterium fortuitum]
MSAAANRARTNQAGRRQAVLAQRALTALTDPILPGPHVVRWIQALQLRINHPDWTLAQLGQSMTPPITKHAYAALLRRALRAGEITADPSAEHAGRDWSNFDESGRTET